MNLVGSLDPSALTVHVEDSLAAAGHVPSGSRVVDLGSGAGFPGIPLAVARPDLEICLVESRERRVHFLRHVSRRLGISVEVRRCRLEEGPEGAPYSVVMMRAVAPLARAVALGRPWVSRDGELWVWSREAVPEAWGPPAGEIPLGPERGRVVRLHEPAVSRGTVPG